MVLNVKTAFHRQHPHLSHWKSSRVFLTITHVGHVSLIYTRSASSSHQTLPKIGWPEQTGRTIHFNNKLHNYPSPDIITNPATDHIHNCVYTIVHIYDNIKKQFTTPAIPITHFTNSTALVERPRQTDCLPMCHRLARHHRGANLE